MTLTDEQIEALDAALKDKCERASVAVRQILAENVDSVDHMPGFALIITLPQSPVTFSVSGNAHDAQCLAAMLALAQLTMPKGEPHRTIKVQ